MKNQDEIMNENEKIYAECGKLEQQIEAAKKDGDIILENESLKRRRDFLVERLGELSPSAIQGDGAKSPTPSTSAATPQDNLTERCRKANAVQQNQQNQNPTPKAGETLTDRCRSANGQK